MSGCARAAWSSAEVAAEGAEESGWAEEKPGTVEHEAQRTERRNRFRRRAQRGESTTAERMEQRRNRIGRRRRNPEDGIIWKKSKDRWGTGRSWLEADDNCGDSSAVIGKDNGRGRF